MKFTNCNVYNFQNALRGLRNPLNSWEKSDSYLYKDDFVVGDNDLKLACNLIKAGASDRKFLRQIFVSIDIEAPIYWWKEMDQYKIATVTNSQSTMHKLATTPITLDCFEIDDYCKDLIIDSGIDDGGDNAFKYEYILNDFIEPSTNVSFYFEETIIGFLEQLRQKYLETKDKKYWKELIRWLPESWLQTRTWTANYEVLRNIYHQRKNHKLTEWHSFCNFIETLPYAKYFIIE